MPTTIVSLPTILVGLLAFTTLFSITLAANNDINAFENLVELLRVIVPLSPLPPKGWADGSTKPSSTTTSSSSTSTGWNLKPTAGTSWNIQLATVPSISAADDEAYKIWDFDMVDASAELIGAFHAKNHSVICYFSAGSWEKYRSDADSFPEEALGKVMDGWPDEKWIDTRNQGVRDLMKGRIEMAKKKGCDGVDPDNIDGYNNDSGFDMTSDDAVDFVRFLAQTAHDAGLSYGLKNGGDIVDQVVDVAEWCVQEECVFYDECELYQPFIEANKPVFHLEYPDEKKGGKEKFIEKSCNGKDAEGFSTLVKNLSLDEWTESCS